MRFPTDARLEELYQFIDSPFMVEMPGPEHRQFKRVVVPIVKDVFECALRNDLLDQNNKQQQGWKNLRVVGL